jgi:hypothetical protein
MFAEFWDEAEGGFYFTGKSHEALLARNKDAHDNATPSGNAMAATALLRLAKLTGQSDFVARAERTMRLFHGVLEKAPLAAGQMLLALDFYLGPVDEYAVIGEAAAVHDALRKLRSEFRPNQVVAWRTPGGPPSTLALLQGKEGKGAVTVYRCREGTCQSN